MSAYHVRDHCDPIGHGLISLKGKAPHATMAAKLYLQAAKDQRLSSSAPQRAGWAKAPRPKG